MITTRMNAFGAVMPAVPPLLLGMLVLAAGGCNGGSAPPKWTPPAPRVDVAPVESKPRQPRRAPHPLVGLAAPSLRLAATDGSRFDLAGQRGQVVVLDFWATWCGPCRTALPVIAQVCRDYADKGVVFRAVNIKEDGTTIRTFLDAEGLDVDVVMDDTGAVAAAYRAEVIPQTVIVGEDGKIQAVNVGAEEGLETRLRKQLDALLEGKSLVPTGGNVPRVEPA